MTTSENSPLTENIKLLFQSAKKKRLKISPMEFQSKEAQKLAEHVYEIRNPRYRPRVVPRQIKPGNQVIAYVDLSSDNPYINSSIPITASGYARIPTRSEEHKLRSIASETRFRLIERPVNLTDNVYLGNPATI